MNTIPEPEKTPAAEDPAKAKSKSVSLLPALWERVEAKAEKDYGGNRSSYARDLFLADLDGKGVGQPGIDPEILVTLARTYAPLLAKRLEAALFKVQPPVILDPLQPEILVGLLGALLHALESGAFDQNAKIRIFSEAEEAKWLAVSEGRMRQLAGYIVEQQQKAARGGPTANSPVAKSSPALPPAKAVYPTRAKRKRA